MAGKERKGGALGDGRLIRFVFFVIFILFFCFAFFFVWVFFFQGFFFLSDQNAHKKRDINICSDLACKVPIAGCRDTRTGLW